eukprot:m.12456 g.12456  ORF g.12456 m.12456 type:complete len:119 (+) comp7212_c0_seq1:183-539(+)
MVYVFICKNDGGKWTAKATGETDSSLTADGASFDEIAVNLKKVVTESAEWNGPVQINHSHVTPNSSVFVCNLGAVVASGPVAAATGDNKTAEDTKEAEPEPEEEEESDDDMDGFSLFD